MNERPWNAWLPEALAEVKRLVTVERRSNRYIAKELGKTPGQIAGLIWRNGWSKTGVDRCEHKRAPRAPRAAPREHAPRTPKRERAPRRPVNKHTAILTAGAPRPSTRANREEAAQRASEIAAKVSKAPPAAVATKPVTLDGLTRDTCRWPLGDYNDKAEFYCGDKPMHDATPYCTYHARIGYSRAGAVYKWL